ncbi:probable mitochondrial ribosomal protein L2 of the large subunit [Cephalotrichum gorgonifer]|uniref:Large ribosomal subunit protein uL2m n=1 Tax=Cephalotrichum gorgonifer TaxID=2041049 RepID=A0AAE8SRK6_9PEZI|nr:probable mitochondrial ribosomal protein L2 of the large subunit [Cephalotrichum gorgonifer]
MIRPRLCPGRGGQSLFTRFQPNCTFLSRQYAIGSDAAREAPRPAAGSAAAPTPSSFGPKTMTTQNQGRETVTMRTYKPTTPGLRHLKRPINDHLWKGRPFLPLTFPKRGHGKGGRNVHGRITVRHRGGGVARRIRTVDFMRWRPGPHIVDRIEYDPGRTAHIALLTEQATGRKTYIVAAEDMRAGDVVQSYRSGIPQDLLDSMGGFIDPGILAAKTAFRGNCLPVHLIPVGTVVYNVGSRAKAPAVFCRSAGTHATIISKEEETRDDGTKVMTGQYVTVQLQSGEIRRIHKDACATIGTASNPNHQYRQLGKAGRSRLLNIRPTVRGLAMNRVDHPHGGGRGKSKSNRHPTSPWGTPAKGGYKTRRKSNHNKWVVVPRVRNVEKRRAKNAKKNQ